MKEYEGANAKNFYWGLSNLYLINPALDRAIPKVKKGNLLDVGCGHGHYYPIAMKKSYTYVGVDNSRDMLEEGRRKHNEAKLFQGDARRLDLLNLTAKFDIILCNMLFTSFSRTSDVRKVFQGCAKLITNKGRMVVSAAHPVFDGYMQNGILNRKEIKADFRGYFEEGAKYQVRPESTKYYFTDYHHTLEMYINAATRAGLILDDLDDCRPAPRLKKLNLSYFENKMRIPTYLVLTFIKR